jgi:cytochrome P450
VRLDIGGRTYLLSDPVDIKHVLIANADNYDKSPRIIGNRARRFFGDGVVTKAGQEHLRQRRILAPLFHRAVVERFASVIVAQTEAMLDTWKDGGVIDVHQGMLDVTQRIIGRVLFGDEPKAQLDRFARAISDRRRYQELYLGSVIPFIDRLPTRTRRDYHNADRVVDEIVGAGIRRRRATASPSTDILSMLVQATYEDGTGMSDTLIRDETRTLALAGYETLAEALTWTWFLLSQAHAEEQAVANEASSVCAGRRIGAADVPDLPFCRMVLAEAIRLYPPAWLFLRMARQDDVLPSRIGVPAGTKIYLCPWVLHRDPRHFPDPGRFDPTRFSDAVARSRPRLAYLPFAAGRRACIGEDFAWMQGVLMIATIARRFSLELTPGQTIVPDPNVTLRPRGAVQMRTVRR